MPRRRHQWRLWWWSRTPSRRSDRKWKCLPVSSAAPPSVASSCWELTKCTDATAAPSMATVVVESNPVPAIRSEVEMLAGEFRGPAQRGFELLGVDEMHRCHGGAINGDCGGGVEPRPGDLEDGTLGQKSAAWSHACY